MSTVLKKHYMSPFPANNVNQHNESIATNTVYADIPTTDSSFTCAQHFVETEALIFDVYDIKIDKQFVNTFEDTIHRCGAPTIIVSDSA